MSKNLRNKDMRPPNVESNLYQYHLKQLQREKYIKKVNTSYSLAPKGLAYAITHSAELKKERPQPRIVTVLFITNHKGELLIRTKQRQPFMGMFSLVMGKMHINETVVDAAKREYIEKVNQSLDNLTFKQIGVSHTVIRQDDFVVSDKIDLLVSVEVSDDIVLKEHVAFYPIDALGDLLMSPGTKELIEAFLTKKSFSESRIDFVE